MSRPIVVLRPEPGNRATAEAIEAAGRRAIRLPLFETRAVEWQAPDPGAFDALLLTSANAVRHAGRELAALAGLPVHAVGQATAAAAAAAGLTVASVGDSNAAALVARANESGVRRALLLGGRERMLEPGGIVTAAITVYASDVRDVSSADAASLAGSVALVQSARAGARLADLLAPEAKARTRIAAVSPAAAAAAGAGWERVGHAARPSNEALIALALALAD